MGGEAILDRVARQESAAAIAGVQEPSGLIPWVAGGRADPWNHLEAAMALAAVGEAVAARRAIEWLAAHQRADGAWHAAYGADGSVIDDRLDTNGTAYVAAALHLFSVATGDLATLSRHWPMLSQAVAFVLRQQRRGGEVCWSDAAPGEPGDLALVAGCSSIYLSLHSAAACAALLGRAWPEVEAAAVALRAALVWRPGAFLPKDEYAMDWYYPVLTGVLAAAAGRRRLRSGWRGFVSEGRGVLCQSHRRWVTTAETAECALACLRCGLGEEAVALLGWTASQRRPDGSYLTGLVYPERSQFPPGEATSYSVAAVLLADDALSGGPAAAVFAPGLATSRAAVARPGVYGLR